MVVQLAKTERLKKLALHKRKAVTWPSDSDPRKIVNLKKCPIYAVAPVDGAYKLRKGGMLEEIMHGFLLGY